MKRGVGYFLVSRSMGWKGMSKRFSILYDGKWLNNSGTNSLRNSGSNNLSSTSTKDNLCCLSRKDVLRFLISYLGALAPLPLSSISYLDSLSLNFLSVDASSPAITASKVNNRDPCVVAIVDRLADSQLKIIGEISASNLAKCDYLAAAWALANLSAGEFIMDADERASFFISKITINNAGQNDSGWTHQKPDSPANPGDGIRRISRASSAPLTCKATSSLAAVMAQMLSHRATHVWVTDDQVEDVLVGIVTYTDVLRAITRPTNMQF